MMVPMLPRLWFKDFNHLSLVALDDYGDSPLGFLVGYVSPSNQTKAYVHFIGTDPMQRFSSWPLREVL